MMMQHRESSRLVPAPALPPPMPPAGTGVGVGGVGGGLFGDRLVEAIHRQIPCLIITLLALVVVNLFLILWIVFAMNLHQNAPFVRKPDESWLRVQADMVEASNQTTMFANLVEYMPGKQQSNADDEMPPEPFKLIGGSDDSIRMESLPNKLRLTDAGDLDLKINRLSIETDKPHRAFHLDAERMVVEDDIDHLRQQPGGLQTGELQTQTVVGAVGQEFRVESRRECLDLRTDGDDEIRFESVNGPVEVEAHGGGNIEIDADRHLTLDGRAILLPNLDAGSGGGQQQQPNDDNNDTPEAYQVCICQNGIIFAVPGSETCQADRSVCDPAKSEPI